MEGLNLRLEPRLKRLVDGPIDAAAAQRQIFNYSRATRYGVGLLLHFGPRPEVHRFVDHPKRVAPGMGGTGLKQDESG